MQNKFKVLDDKAQQVLKRWFYSTSRPVTKQFVKAYCIVRTAK